MAFWQMRILASISAGKVRSRAQGQKGLVHICTKTFVPGIFFLFTMATPCPAVTPCSGVRLDKQEQEMWRVEGVQGIGWGDGDVAHCHFYGEIGCCWPVDNCGAMPVQVPGSQARTLEGFLKNQESRHRPGDLHSTSLSKQGFMATLMRSRCACMCDYDKAMCRAGTAAASCVRC